MNRFSINISKQVVKTTTLSVFTMFIMAASGCKPTPKEAADYNEKIVVEQQAIIEKLNVVDASLKNYRPVEMDSAYAAADKQISLSIIKLQKVEAFNGSTDFKDSALNIFKLYQELLHNEYKELITILKKSEEEYTLEDELRANKLHSDIIEKLSNAYEDIIAIQTAFAEKYNIVLNKTN